MGPLIEITTVPIEIEMKTTHSHLVYSRGTAEVEISRDKGGLNIKSRPIKLNVDSFQAQSSVRPTAVQSIQQSAQRGEQAAYQATATYAKRGQLCRQLFVVKRTARVAQGKQRDALHPGLYQFSGALEQVALHPALVQI